MTNRPFVFGGLMVGCGYFWAMIRRVPRPVSDELIAFRRREQMQRLKNFLTRNRTHAKSQMAAPEGRA
jgi:hypothetical protein